MEINLENVKKLKKKKKTYLFDPRLIHKRISYL